jgi:ariadne-1
MESGDEYEYDENDDEDYNYEDGDDYDANNQEASAADQSSHSLNRSTEQEKSSHKKSPGQMDKTLIRENSSSYELIVPTDSYVIRPLSDISPLLVAFVNEVSTLLDISEDEAQGILQHFKWDKEKLTDAYFSNPEKVRLACGLDLFSSSQMQRLLSDNNGLNGKFKCRICCDEESDLSQSFSLGCNHPFCKICFSEYLKNSVGDGAASVTAHCPEHKCKQLVTKTIVHSLLAIEESEKYDLFFLRDFIEKSKNMKYCPAPRCDKVAVGSGVTTVKCVCHHSFCFKCGEEAHDPCSCSQLTDWQEKCMNESETANWILANTRKCPQCTTRIEKNQGCNHMTCKICKHEFCWICMGTWSEHGQGTGGFYKCNRYENNEINSQVTAAQKAKAELDR